MRRRVDFSFPKGVLEYRERVRKFVSTRVDARAQEIGRPGTMPGEIVAGAGELGLVGPSIPKEYGGAGIGMGGKCAIYEEVGKTSNACTTVVGGHTGIGSVGIVELGNEEQ